MSKKGGAALQKDVPWRASSAVKPIPKIHHSPVLRIAQNPYSDYALSVMKVRSGLIIGYICKPSLIFMVFVFCYGILMVHMYNSCLIYVGFLFS